MSKKDLFRFEPLSHFILSQSLAKLTVIKCFTFQEEQRPYIGLINNNGYACLACYFIANSPHEITEHMALCHSSQLHQNNQIQIQNNNEALNQSMQHSPKIDDGSDRGSPMNMMQANAGTPPSR